MCHGFAAYLLGDKTAQYNGRLTLNPLSHIDPLGFLCMVLFRFGWAKPVPVNPRNFKNPKVGMAVTAFAGPLSNFLLAFAALFAYVAIIISGTGRFLTALATFLMILGELSVGLGIFNLLPIPPLDGSKIMFMFLPNKAVRWFYNYEGYIRLVLLLGLYFGLFDSIIGLDRLRAMHINDSMNPPSAHKDRHARIGEGHIGSEAIINVINHPLLCHLPFYLETPQDTNDGYANEIAMLRAAYKHT